MLWQRIESLQSQNLKAELAELGVGVGLGLGQGRGQHKGQG